MIEIFIYLITTVLFTSFGILCLFVYASSGTDGLGLSMLYDKKRRYLFRETLRKIKAGEYDSIDNELRAIIINSNFKIDLYSSFSDYIIYYQKNANKKEIDTNWIEHKCFLKLFNNLKKDHDKKEKKRKHEEEQNIINDAITAMSSFNEL